MKFLIFAVVAFAFGTKAPPSCHERPCTPFKFLLTAGDPRAPFLSLPFLVRKPLLSHMPLSCRRGALCLTLPTTRVRVRCNHARHLANIFAPLPRLSSPAAAHSPVPPRSRAQCRCRPRGGGRPSRGGRGLRDGQVQPGKGVQIHRQWRRERVYGGGDLRDVQELPRVQRQPELRLGPRLLQVSRRAAREEGVPVQVPRW